MKDVTVVIPAFGAAATLHRALDSVLGEAAAIVVLDGPDAAAEAVLSAYEDVEVVRVPDHAGAAAARNQGLARVQTDYVMFLDADDHVEGSLLTFAIAAAKAEAADVVFGDYVYDWPDGSRTDAGRPYLSQDMSWKGIIKSWLAGGFTPPCAVVWKATFVRGLGGWDESLHKTQDGDLVYRALFENPRIAIAAGGFGVYVQHDGPGRISNQSGRDQTDSQFRVLEKIYARSGPRLSAWRTELGLAYVRIADVAAGGGFTDLEAMALERAAALGSGDRLGGRPLGPMKGVYINLDRAVDRRAEIEAELAKLQADRYERFSALDGQDLPTKPGVRNPSMLGRYRSHLEVIRANIGHDGWLHVMQDDAMISRRAAEAIGLVTATAAFARFDIIFTNVIFDVTADIFAELRRTFDRTVEVDAGGNVTQVKTIEAAALANADFRLTTSYLVNPRAIEQLADLLSGQLENRPFAPIDVVLSRLSRAKTLSMACVVPFLTLPRIGPPSTVATGLDPGFVPLRLTEAVFYADRDVAQLRALLDADRQAAPPSVTSDLLADAYRQMLGLNIV